MGSGTGLRSVPESFSTYFFYIHSNLCSVILVFENNKNDND